MRRVSIASYIYIFFFLRFVPHSSQAGNHYLAPCFFPGKTFDPPSPLPPSVNLMIHRNFRPSPREISKVVSGRVYWLKLEYLHQPSMPGVYPLPYYTGVFVTRLDTPLNDAGMFDTHLGIIYYAKPKIKHFGVYPA